MAIVGGLDIHRRQITYDILDTGTGETRRGQLNPATRTELRAWLGRSPGNRPTSPWRARPAGGSSPRKSCEGFVRTWPSGRHPGTARPQAAHKTDRTDAHHLCELLSAGALPESWMPPAHIANARTQVRLRRALVGERTRWYQRIHAILLHHGLAERSQLLTADGRAWLARVELPAAARQAVELGLRMIDQLEGELDRLDTELARIACHQPGCTAYHTLRELGDQALVPPSFPPPPDQVGRRALGPTDQLMWCVGLLGAPAATLGVGGLHGRAAAPALCGNPITQHVADTGPSTKIRLDARAYRSLPSIPGHAA